MALSMGLPQYDPNLAQGQVLQGAQQIGQIPQNMANLAQTQAATQGQQIANQGQAQLNERNPALNKYLSILNQPGVDPAEMGMRARLEAHGILPTGTEGLHPDHPLHAAHARHVGFGLDYGPYTALGENQTQQPPQGAQPSAPPEVGAETARLPTIGGPPSPNPEAMSYRQFQVVAPYQSRAEAAQARYYEALTKKTIAEGHEAGATERTKATNLTKEDIANIVAATRGEATAARERTGRYTADQRLKGVLATVGAKLQTGATKDAVYEGMKQQLRTLQVEGNKLRTQIGPMGPEEQKAKAEEFDKRVQDQVKAMKEYEDAHPGLSKSGGGTTTKATSKVPAFGGPEAKNPGAALAPHPQDDAAREWAQANQGDPRAAKILAALG